MTARVIATPEQLAMIGASNRLSKRGWVFVTRAWYARSLDLDEGPIMRATRILTQMRYTQQQLDGEYE